MVALTDESDGSSPLTIAMSKPVIRPCTFVTSCRTEKEISDCSGSTFQVPVR